MARYNDKGEEIPDTTPVAVPARFQRTEQDALHEEIRRVLFSSVMQSRFAAEGFETAEEADDFDVDDEVDSDLPISPAERAAMMAEELEGHQADMVELEGELAKERSTQSAPQGAKEGAEGGSKPLPGGPGAAAPAEEGGKPAAT